jgi:Enoyl-(Acyl carrier protein) reductase
MYRNTFTPEMTKAMTAKFAAGRLAQPEEISNVIAFLASDAASYMNGATVPVVCVSSIHADVINYMADLCSSGLEAQRDDRNWMIQIALGVHATVFSPSCSIFGTRRSQPQSRLNVFLNLLHRHQ